MKQCNCCCKVFDSIPKDAKLSLDAILPGYYFNCECNSTLVISLGEVRKAKFHALSNHLVIGKSYKRLTQAEVEYCNQVLDETAAMDDNKFVFTVNRLGICSHPEFKNFKHSSDMWALLLQSIDIDKQIRRHRE